MYDKQYEVEKVCTLAKIFETICFGVQKATNYIYLFQTKAQAFANKNKKSKIYQNKLLSLQVHFFEYRLTELRRWCEIKIEIPCVYFVSFKIRRKIKQWTIEPVKSR